MFSVNNQKHLIEAIDPLYLRLRFLANDQLKGKSLMVANKF